VSTPDYSRNDPRGWCGDPKRGAAMGRHSDHCPGYAGRLHIKLVVLNMGGYDRNGTYFGIGAPLYWVSSPDGEVDYMLRAADRRWARDMVLVRYPEAKVRK
jgi:hypothetical protein